MLLGKQAAQDEPEQAANQNEEEYDQRYRQWTHDLGSSCAMSRRCGTRKRLPDRLCCRPSLQKTTADSEPAGKRDQQPVPPSFVASLDVSSEPFVSGMRLSAAARARRLRA